MLQMINKYSTENESNIDHCHIPTLLKALEIVVKYNTLKCCDYSKTQSAGTATRKISYTSVGKNS
jgi:hypothetical protein